MRAVEATRPGDRYADYCLWDYQPPGPTGGKLRSVSLLRNAFDAAGLDERADAVCARISDAIGPFQTVWGAKLQGGRLGFELYFYDYGRLERQVSVERVLAAMQPLVGATAGFPATRPYFMFSLDLDADILAGRRPIDEVNAYIGNPGSSVSSGISYIATGDGPPRLANFYFFFDRVREWEDIVAKVACSAHLDLPRSSLDDVLWPEMLGAKTIVVANKRFNDSVYFSRVGIDQLIFFAARLGYPEAIQTFLRDNRSRLDHLLYDVGIDYVTRDGRVEILKSGYYGIF